MIKLRKHQYDSLKTSVDNNFSSGVHFHATGTGKTLIAFNLIFEFIKINPLAKLIFWICEKKSILQQQFDIDNLNKLHLKDPLKSFLILNLNEKSTKDWHASINASTYWNKPTLVVINRNLLTIRKLYTKIVRNIDLIIHDECHSIINNSSQEFYTWLQKFNSKCKCIGFSATPYTLNNININPFKNILSKFTMFDAYKGGIILPPIIERFELTNSYTYRCIAELIQMRIKEQPFKKIVVWCGTICFCNEMLEIFVSIYKNFSFCIDTSLNKVSKSSKCQTISKHLTLSNNKVITFTEFYNLESNGILFCAGKHKEGSDIPNLDTCVFLDYVENRCKNNFIQ